MNNKISMGYGGVEFTDKGFNILTTPQPLKSEDGIFVEGLPDKVQQMMNLALMQQFLDAVLFERVYVEPVTVGQAGPVYSAAFMVNNYVLQVTMDGEDLYPALIPNVEDPKQQPIKFSYDGDQLDNFFSEIRKDLGKIVHDNL